MANFELDPLFIKALRLLHSKAKDSTEQLKQLLDDVLHSHTSSSIYGQDSKDGLSSFKHASYGSKKLSSKQTIETTQQSSKKSSKEDDVKRKEAEKRTFDKLKQDLDIQVQEAKKSRLESPKIITNRSPSPAVLKEDDSSDDNTGTSATDIALEMGLACVVCRSFDVASGNTLVECQDCHSLYHQECHKPMITDQDVNDPRLVWYCAKCTKNMRKMASKNQKSGKPVTSISAKETISVGKIIKPESVVVPPTPSHIFKRAEPKVTGTTSTAQSTVTGNKPIGLAGLAASLSGKSNQVPKTSQSGASKSSSAVKTSTSGISIAKPTITQSSSSSIKSNQFSNLLSSTKISSQSSGSSSSQTATGTSTSSVTSATSTFLPVKSSSASSLVTTSTSKASSTTVTGNNGSSSANLLSSKSAGSGSSSSSSSMMSADKRLQIMKKKAAAKMQEKRRLSSK